MQNLLVTALITAVFYNFTFAQNQSMDTVSYSLGVVMSKNLKEQGFDEVDANALATGISDLLSGKELKVTEKDARRIVNEYFSNKKKEQFAPIIAESEKFLAENAARSEVTTLPSGLQYEVINSGEGENNPQPSSRVTVHYEGRLVDGTVFDSSVKRGNPATFGVTQVISGWTEALQLMVPGDKWRLFIPHNLAYGDRGAPPKIQPYAALVFEVELLEIK